MIEEALKDAISVLKKIHDNIALQVQSRLAKGLNPLSNDEALLLAIVALAQHEVIYLNCISAGLHKIIYAFNMLQQKIKVPNQYNLDLIIANIKNNCREAQLSDILQEVWIDKFIKLVNIHANFNKLYFTAVAISLYINDQAIYVVMEDLREYKNLPTIDNLELQYSIQKAAVEFNLFWQAIKKQSSFLNLWYIFVNEFENFERAVNILYPPYLITIKKINLDFTYAEKIALNVAQNNQIRINNIANLSCQLASNINKAEALLNDTTEITVYAQILLTLTKLKARFNIVKEQLVELNSYFGDNTDAQQIRVSYEQLGYAAVEFKRLSEIVRIIEPANSEFDAKRLEPIIGKLDSLYINWHYTWQALKTLLNKDSYDNIKQSLENYDADFRKIIQYIISMVYHSAAIEDLSVLLKKIITDIEKAVASFPNQSDLSQFNLAKAKFITEIDSFNKEYLFSNTDKEAVHDEVIYDQELAEKLHEEFTEAKQAFEKDKNIFKYISKIGTKFIFILQEHDSAIKPIAYLFYLGAGNYAKVKEYLAEDGERIIIKNSAYKVDLEHDENNLALLPASNNKRKSKLIAKMSYRTAQGKTKYLIAMEKMPGIETIRAVCLQIPNGAWDTYLPLNIRYIIAIKMIDAAHRLHFRHGIIHCDLSYRNAMLYIDKRQGVGVSIVDYGLARTFLPHLGYTWTNEYFTPPVKDAEHVAPEMFRPGFISPKTDARMLGHIFANQLHLDLEAITGIQVDNVNKRLDLLGLKKNILHYIDANKISMVMAPGEAKKAAFSMKANFIANKIVSVRTPLKKIMDTYVKFMQARVVTNEKEYKECNIVSIIAMHDIKFSVRAANIYNNLAKMMQANNNDKKHNKAIIKKQLIMLILELYNIYGKIYSHYISKIMYIKRELFKQFIDNAFALQCKFKEYFLKLLKISSLDDACVQELNILDMLDEIYTTLYKIACFIKNIKLYQYQQSIIEKVGMLESYKNNIKFLMQKLVLSPSGQLENLCFELHNLYLVSAELAADFEQSQYNSKNFLTHNNKLQQQIKEVLAIKDNPRSATLLLRYQDYKASVEQKLQSICSMDPVQRTVKAQYKR